MGRPKAIDGNSDEQMALTKTFAIN